MSSVPRVIYQFWTGDNKMSPDRKASLDSSKNLGVETRLLTASDLMSHLLPDVPLHPAYPYLSCNHRSDYLRCYFMHHFGGGYADIKTYSRDNNWSQSFDYIDSHSECLVVGQADTLRGAAPNCKDPRLVKYLVANGYFIVRANSDFTRTWWNRVNALLDSKLEALRRNPSLTPRDFNETPGYPLKWTELQGNIFHKICAETKDLKKVCPILRSGRTSGKYL